MLSKIKEELAHVLKHIQDKTAIQEIKKVIKSVSDDDKIDQEWETFAKHFDTVHSDFVVTLKKNVSIANCKRGKTLYLPPHES